MVSFQKLFGANLSHVETQSMPVSMTVARKLRDWILGDDKLATFPTVVLLAFVALWKIEKACTSLLCGWARPSHAERSVRSVA